ncbi:MAG: hypothetical protein P8099_10380 [Gemmatimonadota bacterium]|jgi:hypothetical protein
MSRAFVKEDAGDFDRPRDFELPPAEDPGYDLACALALLNAACLGETRAAETATGYRWGDPHLIEHVRKLLGKEEDLSEEQQDRRFMQVARRYLRAAGK